MVEQGDNSPQFDGGESAANTASNQMQQQSQQQPQDSGSKAIFDLDKAEKFTFRGKEYTKEQLEKEFMMRSDYTKKTQEIADIKKEASYVKNLEADLESVKQDPRLALKFKELYPEKFHKYLDLIGVKVPERQSSANLELPPEIQAKIDRLESYMQSTEVAKIETQLDTQFSQLSQKYPHGDEDVVLARAQAYLDQDVKMTPELWENLWKQSHEKTLNLVKNFKTTEFNKQREANKRAHEPAPGGGTPGQAPRKESMKEATDRAVRELSQRSRPI